MNGMKRLILIMLLIQVGIAAQAAISAIAIQTEKNSSMQVYLNGKLCNAQAKSFVRVKSTPGLFRVELKVLNPNDKVWYLIKKDVRVEKGYEFHYKVVFQKDKRPTLELVKRYPVFNNYFNPSAAYKYPIA
jgi:hypothetical protein